MARGTQGAVAGAFRGSQTRARRQTPETAHGIGAEATDQSRAVSGQPHAGCQTAADRCDRVGRSAAHLCFCRLGSLRSSAFAAKSTGNLVRIKAADGLNDQLFETLNYDALVAAGNKWLVSDGVLSFVGFRGLQIDGNKANQTAGDGVRMFANGLVLDNFLLRDAYGVGLLTYGGDVAGQDDWYDMPEGRCGPVAIRNCGSHGWHTLWSNSGTGQHRIVDITGYAVSGQTAFSGNAPNADDSEEWRVCLNENGTRKGTKFEGMSVSFAADAAAETSTVFTFNHGLLTTPKLENISVGVNVTDSGGGTAYGASGCELIIQSVSSTQIAVKVVVDRPSSAGALGYVVCRAHL